MNVAAHRKINLDGRRVDYRLVKSRAARRIRVRVGPGGVEVVLPASKGESEVESFLRSNAKWLIGQLDRVERFSPIRRLQMGRPGEILYRGEVTKVRVQKNNGQPGTRSVAFENNGLVVTPRNGTPTSAARTLENWLRKRAREEIHQQIDVFTLQLKRRPSKVYVRGQRTKWGNCSRLKNLSFNWRLILAPYFVLRYLVAHEVVHLAVPDHSARFWLTVQSLCPDVERAKRWLSTNGEKMFVDLEAICDSQGLGK